MDTDGETNKITRKAGRPSKAALAARAAQAASDEATAAVGAVRSNGAGTLAEAAVDAPVPASEPAGGNGAALPDIDELPEEPEAEGPKKINPAAGAEKFKKFAEIRRDPNATLAPVNKRQTSIPARGPHKNWFVRTSTNPNHNGTLTLYWDKAGDGAPYLVDETCHHLFGENDVRNNYCVLSITRQGTLFLWCGPLEGEDGEWNSWHRSAHDMKEVAAGTWISVRGNKQAAGYEYVVPLASYPEPSFPDLPWEEIVHLAFRRHLIETEDHPVIRRLLGAT